MGEEFSSTPSMSKTIPRGENGSLRVMRVSKAPFLSTPEREYRCSQQAGQRETRAPVNGTRPVAERYYVGTLRNSYAAQRDIHFVDLGRPAIHAGVPAGIVIVGEHHHAAAAHIRADGDVRGRIPGHKYGIFGLRASRELRCGRSQDHRFRSQFVQVAPHELQALIYIAN